LLFSSAMLLPFISGCSLFSTGSSKYRDPFAPEDVVDGLFYTVDEEGGYAIFNGIYDNLAFDRAYQNVKTFEVRSEYKGHPVKIIKDHALSAGECSSIEKIIIPPSVETIDDGAFFACQNIKEIVLNEGLKVIGNQAFFRNYDYALINFILPSSLTKIGFDALPISKNVLTIPPSIEHLGNGCLRGNIFEDIYLPASLQEIGFNVFQDCTARSIVMSDEIRAIPREAFMWMHGVERIHLSNSLTLLPERALCSIQTTDPEDQGKVIEITGGEGIKTIKEEACMSMGIKRFPYSPVLETIEGERTMYYVGNRDFPSTLTYIASGAFRYLADDPGAIPAHYPSRLTYVPDKLFSGCNFAETSIIMWINDGASIGEEAFALSNLTAVEFHGTGIKIKDYAFYGCSELESITYGGTSREFSAISKGKYWHEGVKATYVQCSDGMTMI
ncbi:MAG: leucine-rich repeat protein, partial [Bacilli bacterium]|nr:leucine-rich repeat protein [Bacilli bacterium]